MGAYLRQATGFAKQCRRAGDGDWPLWGVRGDPQRGEPALLAVALVQPPHVRYDHADWHRQLRAHADLAWAMADVPAGEHAAAVAAHERLLLLEKFFEDDSAAGGKIVDEDGNELGPAKDEYYLILLAVSPRSKGMGLGSLVLRHMVSMAEQRERDIVLDTSAAALVPYYAKFGFAAQADPRPLPANPPTAASEPQLDAATASTAVSVLMRRRATPSGPAAFFTHAACAEWLAADVRALIDASAEAANTAADAAIRLGGAATGCGAGAAPMNRHVISSWNNRGDGVCGTG